MGNQRKHLRQRLFEQWIEFLKSPIMSQTKRTLLNTGAVPARTEQCLWQYVQTSWSDKHVYISLADSSLSSIPSTSLLTSSLTSQRAHGSKLVICTMCMTSGPTPTTSLPCETSRLRTFLPMALSHCYLQMPEMNPKWESYSLSVFHR